MASPKLPKAVLAVSVNGAIPVVMVVMPINSLGCIHLTGAMLKADKGCGWLPLTDIVVRIVDSLNLSFQVVLWSNICITWLLVLVVGWLEA
jgi:hypothetical protein